MASNEQRVIVVGAGPVGAVMTLALVHKGIRVLLLEAEPAPVEDQRAATIHAPTLEMLVDLGLKEQAFAEDASGGIQAPLFQFRDRATSELIATFDIRLLEGEVPYPYVLQWEQYKLVRAVLPLSCERARRSAVCRQAHRTCPTGRPCRRHRGLSAARRRNFAAHMSSAPTAAAVPCGGSRQSTSKGSPGRSALSRSPPASISSRLARAIARAIISPIPTNGSICSRSRATVRPDTGAASCRCRPMETDEQAVSMEGSSGGCSASTQERRLRHSLLCALCRASARGRHVQQGPRAARRRRRPCQQSDRRYGHEWRHPRRHQSGGQVCRRLVRPRRRGRVRPLHQAAAQGAGRFRPGAVDPEQKGARGEGPGRSAANIWRSCAAPAKTWRGTRRFSIARR